jgi:hypothetical protein
MNHDTCPCGAAVTVSQVPTGYDYWEGQCEAGHTVRWVELFDAPVIVEAS